MFVILVIENGTEDTDPWEVWQAKTYETLEEVQAELETARWDKARFSYQIGRVVPLDGDPDF